MVQHEGGPGVGDADPRDDELAEWGLPGLGAVNRRGSCRGDFLEQGDQAGFLGTELLVEAAAGGVRAAVEAADRDLREVFSASSESSAPVERLCGA
ncbi:hypothetical protein G3I59_09965 [Amycolatopsis rubida]|uniref:Uncharacterized protein n=1 Tax=Amycolatopsis rubida TaxID=112413 RepID=A0ABX0BN47_9PSEU|nr:hypothetical protein [Amycolatopsis rubida]MYW90919.1 hypothetical protein [Amycolatopsis rubida]NEC55904.1 hypothetical protein [Amycolatopsis rubida]